MSYEEYEKILMDYLYIYYGEGYEYIYDYLVMQNFAGTKDECYLNNYSYPQDMYNMEYVRENYTEMRALIVKALAMTSDEDQIEALEKLLVTCDFTGLSCVHGKWYENGENVEGYIENYDSMCGLIEKYDMRPSTFTDSKGDPEQLDFTDYENSPFDQLC